MDVLDKIVDLIIYADKISLIANILLFLIVRALLCTAVYIASRRKKLSECKSYAGVTMVFGIVGYAVFLLITSKVKSDKPKGRIGALTAVSVVLLCANLALFCCTVKSADLNYKTEYYGFDFAEGVFEAENGDKIRYNNLGQGFSLHNMDAFYYEAEGGERYRYDDFADTINEKYQMEYYFALPEYCFNSKGDFYDLDNDGNYKNIFISDDVKVIIDSEGELYYYIENCYFDKNGDFVFTDERLYNLTYDIAVKYLQDNNIASESKQYDYQFNVGYYKNEYIYKNDKGLYVVYDKLGNEYSICDAEEGFMYQDKSGKVYSQTVGLDSYFLYDENGKGYGVAKHIDKDGYISFATDLTCVEVTSSIDEEYYFYVFYDSDGNLYYSPEDCYWDKDGNLKLSKYVADVTFERLDEGTVIA